MGSPGPTHGRLEGCPPQSLLSAGRSRGWSGSRTGEPVPWGGQRVCAQTPVSERPSAFVSRAISNLEDLGTPGGPALCRWTRGSELPRGLRSSGNQMEAGGCPPPDTCSHTLVCMQFQGPVAPRAHSPAPAALWVSSGLPRWPRARLPALGPPGRPRVQQNSALKGQFPCQEHSPPTPPTLGIRLGGRGSSPTAACSLGWGRLVPSVTAALALHLELWWVNIALPLTGRGALAVRHGAGDGRPAGHQAAGTLRAVSGCHPPGGAWGCRASSVSSPQAVSRPSRPGGPPSPFWAGQIRTCSRARIPPDWWINLGTALPCPGPLPGSLGMLPEKLLHPWVLGQSPRPQPQPWRPQSA